MPAAPQLARAALPRSLVSINKYDRVIHVISVLNHRCNQCSRCNGNWWLPCGESSRGGDNQKIGLTDKAFVTCTGGFSYIFSSRLYLHQMVTLLLIISLHMETTQPL